MPTLKSKGSPTGHRYRPAAQYDDATLAQKREYWRNKKREQRARLSERRRTAPKQSPGGQLLNTSAPASSCSLQVKNESNKSANISGNTTAANLVAPRSQKEQWLQTMNLNKVACSNSSRGEVKCMTPIVNTGINSILVSQLNSKSSVPPLTHSSSAKATPQPRAPMQGLTVPKNSQNAPIPVFIQPKPLSTDGTTNITFVSSPRGPKSTPQTGTKSALVSQQRPTGAGLSFVKPETEEEKAAKRREHWRIKKREQRARLAALLGKTRNRAQSVEVWAQKTHSGNMASLYLPPKSSLSESGALVQTSFSVAKTEKLQTTGIHRQTNIKPAQTAPASTVLNTKKSAEPMRRSPSYYHLSGISRGRCKTPRQNFINQRILRVKSPSLSYVFGGRDLPKIDPSDTPEQVIAKRREYWRIKKREQRAKLSLEVRSRLKEKDCLQRRVKRYHQILEDMRKARSQPLIHASDTIGGFIKEDGTVTVNIPQVTVNLSMLAHRREQVGNTDAPRRQLQPGNSNFRVNPQPHPPRPVQVKVSVPQSLNKSQKLLPITPTTQLETSHSLILPIQNPESHLTLTHPPASLNLGSGSAAGGCVMKMAVSSRAPSLSAACLDPTLTEEERMARRREYWRVKKREQRAARAIRQRQGVSQARASAVLLKRKAQKHMTAVPLSRRLPNQTGSLSNNNNNNIAALPRVNEIKQESEFVPAVDLNSDQPICPDVEAPVSQTQPPAQADPDPALSADSQAATLLAVASMKKLLEESLSTVVERQTETEIGVETKEEKVEQDIKQEASQLDAQTDVFASTAADVTLQMKSCREDDSLTHEALSSEQKDMSQKTLSPSTSNKVASPSTFNNLSSSCFVVIPKIEASLCSQRRTQRPHVKKAGHQHCCSPEPPKLHHLPVQPQSPTPKVMESSVSCLQKKREYWKLMKRQQRARVKARQRSSSSGASLRNVQSSGCILNKSPVVKPALLPKPSTSPGTPVTSIPTVLVVSPSTANPGLRDTLRVKPPVSSRDRNSNCRMKTEHDVDCLPPSLPTLKPPDNPLSSFNMQPIEPSCQTLTPTLRSVTIPCAPSQNSAQILPPPGTLSSHLVPPKPIPGESDEDFQRRKREYWRIKKKEQRARKAFQEKRRAPDSSWSTLSPQTPPQDSNEWVNSSEEPEHQIDNSVDSDVGSFPDYTVPIEDDDLFADYEGPNGEEGAVSDDVWRNHYLMDYDPLNQLLVCMVCGELQYIHSLEGVSTHIEESHPDTLNLEPGERQRILEAWDEQVSQRERFFTSQLQQHSASMAEAPRD